MSNLTIDIMNFTLKTVPCPDLKTKKQIVNAFTINMCIIMQFIIRNFLENFQYGVIETRQLRLFQITFACINKRL